MKKNFKPVLFCVFFFLLLSVYNKNYAQTGLVRVTKTVSGQPPSGTQSFTFQLRSGATVTGNGTILETQTANAGNGGIVNFATNLVAGQTYQLCEVLLPGWTTSLGTPIFSVYNPAGDNSVVATDFTVTAGQTIIFSIDNTAPSNNCAWQQGDLFTRTQLAWDDVPYVEVIDEYDNVYNQIFFEIGIPGLDGYSLRFSALARIKDYLIQNGNPAPLNADLDDTGTSPSGQFGGEVAALKLNVDFSDAGFLSGTSTVPFGDLVLHDLTSAPQLNGMLVRDVLTLANTLLGGGSGSVSIATMNDVLSELNFSFLNGTPSQFAIDHLLKPNCNQCPTSTLWQAGQMTTYPQAFWGDAANEAGLLLNTFFSDVYPLDLVVGGQYTMRFRSASRTSLYLPASGGNTVLDASLTDPDASSSGAFGGQVVALKLNIDFGDSGYLSNSTNFGDLIIHDYTVVPEVNGLTVREFLDLANNILGGNAGAIIDADIASFVASELNSAFTNGTPSQFAKDHLVLPCETVPTNHCPVATSSSVTIPQGTSKNIELQATDEDNDALTYSISQNPSHGTVSVSATNIATYIPTAGYSGTDQFKFKASDGKCDAEATVNISIVVCPKLKGDWKNNPNAWPASATPMLLGTQSYTKNQLLVILKTSVGTGPKADASLILAQQLIPAKLNIANGTQAPASVTGYISSANALIGSNTIPMNVKPNTTLGKAMTALAASLESFNNGALSTGCSLNSITTAASTQKSISSEEVMEVAKELEVKATPNPSNNYFSLQVRSNNTKEKIVIQVYDVNGKILDVRNSITPGSSVRFGDLYRPGTYFVRVIQGKEHKELKLIKIIE